MYPRLKRSYTFSPPAKFEFRNGNGGSQQENYTTSPEQGTSPSFPHLFPDARNLVGQTAVFPPQSATWIWPYTHSGSDSQQ